MFSYNKTKTKIGIILFISIFLMSCNRGSSSQGRQNNVSVLVGAPKRQSLKEYLELSAEIKPVKEVAISSDVPGKIADMKKYEGQYVRKGETVALVDRFVIGANYALATVRTPISGYVTSTYTTLGASVQAGEAIATVADINDLEVQINVPESQVSRIKLGQDVFIRVASAPGKEIEAKITKKDLAVNTNTRTLMVKGQIDNKDQALLPGMFSDVSILMNSADNVIVVPSSSIFYGEDGKSYVYVVEENTPQLADAVIEKEPRDQGKEPRDKKADNSGSPNKVYKANTREVNILFPSKDKIAISSGIEDGEEIVMFGREFLRDGATVNPLRNDPSLAEYIEIDNTKVTNSVVDTDLESANG